MIHLESRHLFINLVSVKPNPPKSLGLARSAHFTIWYFFFCPEYQKKLALAESILWCTSSGRRYAPIVEFGRELKLLSIRIDFPPDYTNKLCHAGNLFSTFRPTHIRSVVYNVADVTEIPKYFIGSSSSLHFKQLALLVLSSLDAPNTITSLL
jgi:hypothetical protein